MLPSKPEALAEVIENAISEINRRGEGFLVAESWKSLKPTGNLIIDKICNSIEACQLFVCDLTNLNPNVLFELGYAIAQNKRVWILLDTSFEDTKTNFEKLSLLSSVGYAGYQNRDHLVNRFFQERPYDDLDATIYSKIIESNIASKNSSSLFYLKVA